MNEIENKLTAEFDQSAVKYKPACVQGRRALALAYVDARAIQDRLDSVLGVCGWMDEYDVLPDGSVVCRLRLKIGEDWVTKVDVGGPSDQPDSGDRMKAAFSDSLKRAAVKFGIGRYLYRLPQEWRDWDPAKRRFSEPEPAKPVQKSVPPANKSQMTALAAALARIGKENDAGWDWVTRECLRQYGRTVTALSVVEIDQVIRGLEKMAVAAA